MRKTFLPIMMILLAASLAMAQSIAVPDGYAGYARTTGGVDAASITISTASAFKSAVNHNNPWADYGRVTDGEIG